MLLKDLAWEVNSTGEVARAPLPQDRGCVWRMKNEYEVLVYSAGYARLPLTHRTPQFDKLDAPAAQCIVHELTKDLETNPAR